VISREAVLNALANIPDPESKQDIVSANLVGNIEIENDRVYIQVNSITHGRSHSI
jgi:metal-sulfur cluster biosynthetic enzyme